MRTVLLFFLLVVMSGCRATDDDRVKDLVGNLVGALNDHSRTEAARLYMGGKIPPVNESGDSNTVFRLLEIPGGEQFEASDIQPAVIDEHAQVSFALTGTMKREGAALGTMGMRLKIELQKLGDQWLIIPGHEQKETGF